MKIRDRILAALQVTDGLCDDCLSEVTGVHPRQSVNIQCRQLGSENDLVRARETCARCGRMKIINRLLTREQQQAKDVLDAPSETRSQGGRPWYWEGNVQRRIVEYLNANGWTVHSEADTASRQQGKDIVARGPQGELLGLR